MSWQDDINAYKFVSITTGDGVVFYAVVMCFIEFDALFLAPPDVVLRHCTVGYVTIHAADDVVLRVYLKLLVRNINCL